MNAFDVLYHHSQGEKIMNVTQDLGEQGKKIYIKVYSQMHWVNARAISPAVIVDHSTPDHFWNNDRERIGAKRLMEFVVMNFLMFEPR